MLITRLSRFAALLLLVMSGLVSTSARAITSIDEGKGPTVTLYGGANGSLGINAPHPTSQLDVHGGEARVGDSGAACTKDNEGAIRYAKPDLEFCNGADWRIIQSIGH